MMSSEQLNEICPVDKKIEQLMLKLSALETCFNHSPLEMIELISGNLYKLVGIAYQHYCQTIAKDIPASEQDKQYQVLDKQLIKLTHLLALSPVNWLEKVLIQKHKIKQLLISLNENFCLQKKALPSIYWHTLNKINAQIEAAEFFYRMNLNRKNVIFDEAVANFLNQIVHFKIRIEQTRGDIEETKAQLPPEFQDKLKAIKRSLLQLVNMH